MSPGRRPDVLRCPDFTWRAIGRHRDRSRFYPVAGDHVRRHPAPVSAAEAARVLTPQVGPHGAPFCLKAAKSPLGVTAHIR